MEASLIIVPWLGRITLAPRFASISSDSKYSSHAPFGRVDDDCPETGEHVTAEQCLRALLKEAQVAAGVTGRVQDPDAQSGIADKCH